MNHNQMIEKLKKELPANPVLHSVLLMFAMRDRTRRTVTVSGLRLKMNREGFQYTDDQLRGVIKTLAASGLGALDVGPKGGVRGIKDISVTLQSLGAAVCGTGSSLESFKTKHHFAKVSKEAAKGPKEVAKKPALKFTPIVLTAVVNGKPLNIGIPNSFTLADIGLLLDKLRDASASIHSGSLEEAAS